MPEPMHSEATESVSSAEGGWAAEERGADSSDVGARSTVTQTEFEAHRDLIEQVRGDDGTVRYCPDCGLIGPLGWCSHGLGMMALGDQTKRVDAVVPDEAITFSQSEDYPDTFYGYVNVKALP